MKGTITPKLVFIFAILLSANSGIARAEEPRWDFCPVVPDDQFHTLSPECQKKVLKLKTESTRFSECVRLLGLDGVYRAKCNSEERVYVVDNSRREPRVLVLDRKDKLLSQIVYPTQKK